MEYKSAGYFGKFDSIYEAGRLLGDKELEKPIDIDSGIYSLIINLIKYVTNKGFNPGFIEFTLFDPKDRKAKRFYTLLIGRSDDQISKYFVQMGCNIKESETIIPNSILYESSYFFDKKESIKKFKPLLPNLFQGKLSAFNTTPNSVSSLEKVANNVHNFYRRVESNCFDDIEGNDLNSFLVIPIFRPAAPLEEQVESVFRGGALFLFGYTGSGFSISEFVLDIQTILLKSIFEVSFSEIELEKQKIDQTNLELSLYHHFGSNMRNLPMHLESDSFDFTNLNEYQSNILETVKKYIYGYINNTRAVLDAYGKLLSSSKSDNLIITKIDSLINEFEDIRNSINVSIFGIKPENINLQVGNIDGQEQILLAKEIFKNYVEQFINNAVKEYNNSEVLIPIDKRIIDISIYRVESKILFNFFNSETEIDNFTLERVGFKPINSVNSSGLGYYFLNFSLKLCGASTQSDGRFFVLRNQKFPKGVNLSFSFQIKE